MSDQTSEQVQAPAAPPRRRRPQTVRNMVWSLIPLVGLIVFFVVTSQPGKQPVHTVDPTADLHYAVSQMHVPAVLAPHGLSKSWRATSSDLGKPDVQGFLNLSVGYLTPKNQFATFVESNRPVADLVNAVVSGANRDGMVRVGAVDWARYRTGRGETAMAVQQGRISVVVTGSANLTELRTLAGSLR